MKTLFEFTINKKVEIEKESIGKDDKGNEVKGTSIVIEEVPVKVAIKKPTRELSDQSTLFYAVKISEAHKAGVLSAALLRKRFDDDGGILTQKERREFGDLYTDYFQKQSSFIALEAKKIDDLSDKEKLEKDNLKIELGDLVRKISDFENANSQLFENTAETFARRHHIRWWILNLSYGQKFDIKGNPLDELEPIFNALNYDDKLKIYDRKEEEIDPFYLASIRKLGFLINYWYNGQANTEEDFKKLSDAYDQDLATNVSSP